MSNNATVTMETVAPQDSRRDPDQIVIAGASRPLRVNSRTGEVQIKTQRGLMVNSLLSRQEWVEVDQAVMEEARYPLIGVEDLRARGLVKRLGGLGTLQAEWMVSSAVTPAKINMSGRTGGGADNDMPDLALAAVPVPVTFKEFEIDLRLLEASRRMGDALDVTAAREASRVVAEGLEGLLFSGASTISFNGLTIYGYRTHPRRATDTVGNYGGGDWGTIANVVPTVAGMISAARGKDSRGPWMLYVSETQFDQAALTYYTDGSGDTALDRLERLTGIMGVKAVPASTLPATELLLIDMKSSYVQWAQAVDIQTREWTSGDGMVSRFKVMAVATPLIKETYGGSIGIVHATGA